MALVCLLHAVQQKTQSPRGAGEQPLAVLTFITSSSLVCCSGCDVLTRTRSHIGSLRDYCAQVILLAL
jgi:hypothetical protein